MAAGESASRSWRNVKAIIRIGGEWIALHHIVRVTSDTVRGKVAVYFVDSRESAFFGNDAVAFLAMWMDYVKSFGDIVSYVPLVKEVKPESGSINRGDFNEGAD